MTVLPFHPRTGLQAIGFTSRGPIWPVKGAEDPPADPPSDPAPAADPPADPPADPAQDPPKDTTDWKAEARKWEDRAKSNKNAADELDKIKKSQQTEAERLAAERDEATAREQKAYAVAAKSAVRAAADKFVSRDQAVIFAGDLNRFVKDGEVDDKAIAEALEQVLKDNPNLAKPEPEDPKDPKRKRPVEDLKPGGAPTDPPRSRGLAGAIQTHYSQ